MSTNAVLIAVEVIAASIWVGGLVCITLVTRVARSVLDESLQVAFFRALGRRYGVIGTTSLLIAVVTGVVLSWPPTTWSAATTAAFVLAGVLIVTTALGMKQARSMSRRRRAFFADPRDSSVLEAVRRGRRVANALRATMELLTLTVIVFASIALGH